MAGTYSKYDGQAYQALSSKLVLSNDGTQSYAFTNNDVYTDLVNNESKLISPLMLRNAILSIWDTTAFKETLSTNSNVYYIGVDSGNTTDIDLKKKLYLGKRFYNGNEIMSSTLINSEVDIFLYNTKKDSSFITGVGGSLIQDSNVESSQIRTRVSFLAGTNSQIYSSNNIDSPYIESLYVVGATTSYIDMNLVSENGDVIILSKGIDSNTGLDTNSGGTVSINGIGFPTYQNSINTDLNSKILTWYDNGLTWSSTEVVNSDYAGATGSELNIYGSPVNLNGMSLELTDDRRVPIKIGDILPGTTFSSNSISEILGRIIYDYLSPTCNLSINTNEYLEVGTSPQIILNYTINKKTKNLYPTLLTNMIPSSYQSISSDFPVKVSGQALGVVIVPLEATQSNFTIKVSDGDTQNSVTKSISGVYPYFYGFSTQSSISINELPNLTKKIEPMEDKDYDIFGGGNFYFIYDKDYGLLSNIYNNLGGNITASFSYSTKVLSSPDGYWQSKEFYVYKWSNVEQIGPPSEIYQFKY